MRWMVIGLIATTLLTGSAIADTSSNAIDLSDAWIPATSQPGSDVPLYLTMANRSDIPDALIRVRCPTDLADFTEKHATDRGEGGTAMREVKSIPVPAKGTAVLKPGGDHLMLLHLRVPLQTGQTFACSLIFQKAGTVPIEVKVVSAAVHKGP